MCVCVFFQKFVAMFPAFEYTGQGNWFALSILHLFGAPQLNFLFLFPIFLFQFSSSSSSSSSLSELHKLRIIDASNSAAGFVTPHSLSPSPFDCVIELNLTFSQFGKWADVLQVVQAIPRLKTLNLRCDAHTHT